MLRELAELGMRMARAVAVGAEMQAQAGEASAADEAASTLALQRAAKTVRLTVALDKKLHEATQKGNGNAAAADFEAERREAAEASVRLRRKLWKAVGQTMVRDGVERAIENETEAAEHERLFAELNERLTEQDDDLALTGPGAYEGLIVRICKEMGLSGERRRDRKDGGAFAKASEGGPQAANDTAGVLARAHPPP